MKKRHIESEYEKYNYISKYFPNSWHKKFRQTLWYEEEAAGMHEFNVLCFAVWQELRQQ
jgi:hypothetical protein